MRVAPKRSRQLAKLLCFSAAPVALPSLLFAQSSKMDTSAGASPMWEDMWSKASFGKTRELKPFCFGLFPKGICFIMEMDMQVLVSEKAIIFLYHYQ
jgi:hypothetical protein